MVLPLTFSLPHLIPLSVRDNHCHIKAPPRQEQNLKEKMNIKESGINNYQGLL